MRDNLHRVTDDKGELLARNIVMVSYRFDQRTAEGDRDDAAQANYVVPVHSRYCDQPMDWLTRLFGIAGTSMIAALVVGCAFFTWRVVRPMVVSPSAPLVVELRPLAAPPEPRREVATGPERVERQEERPKPEAAIVTPPPMVQLPQTTWLVGAVHKPMEAVIDPGPPVPETTAPKSVAAPAAASVSNDAKQNWEARLLAHLEHYRRFPSRARAARQQGTVQIRFRMNRAGSVLTASIQRSSGFTSLDQAALDTLKRAQPLPAIPQDMPDEVELTIPVEFYLDG